MRGPFLVFAGCALLSLMGAPRAVAQEPAACPPLDAGAVDPAARPAVVIRASATIDEIRFESQPRIEVRLPGCGGIDSVRVLERRNLPDPVQPGVTYRDVYISAEILGRLDVRCLVAILNDDAPSPPGSPDSLTDACPTPAAPADGARPPATPTPPAAGP